MWMKSESTVLGQKPCVLSADGHESNMKQEALVELMRENEVLFAVTPAHTTAKGLQQLDLKRGLISRVKKAFRRIMAKVFRTCLINPDPSKRGRVKYSQVLRAMQMAASEATSAEDNLEDNRRVGYYVDEENYLRYNPMRAVNAAFFETSALFGGGGANRSGLVRNSTQQRIDENLARARTQVQAVAGVIDTFNAPIMPEPTETIGRARKKRSANAEGCIVSSANYLRILREEREEKEGAAELALQVKVDKVRAYAKRWLPDVRAAEESLRELRIDGEADLTTSEELSRVLSVKYMKALIVSRTGKNPKAQSNKDDAFGKELLACMSCPRILQTPPDSPERRQPALNDDDDDTGAGLDEDEGFVA